MSDDNQLKLYIMTATETVEVPLQPLPGDINPGTNTTPHALFSRKVKEAVVLTGDAVTQAEKQWGECFHSVVAMLKRVAGHPIDGWQAEEVEIGLTLDGKGQLWFIAEAHVEASIKVVYKRTKS